MLAYKTTQSDTDGSTLPKTPSVPAADHSHREDPELHFDEAADAATSSTAEPEEAAVPHEIIPTFDLDADLVSPSSPTESEPEPTGEKEPIILDLDDLEGLTINLREVTDEEDEEATTPAESITPRPLSEADAPAYDLDLENDDEPSVRDSALESTNLDDDDARDPPREYILDIEEALELEVDEIEIEEVDDEDEEHDNR
jgi:hypothetical protein